MAIHGVPNTASLAGTSTKLDPEAVQLASSRTRQADCIDGLNGDARSSPHRRSDETLRPYFSRFFRPASLPRRSGEPDPARSRGVGLKSHLCQVVPDAVPASTPLSPSLF